MASVSVRPASVKRAPTIRNEPNGRGEATSIVSRSRRLEVRDVLAHKGGCRCRVDGFVKRRDHVEWSRGPDRDGAAGDDGPCFCLGEPKLGDCVHDHEHEKEASPGQSSGWKSVHGAITKEGIIDVWRLGSKRSFLATC